MADDAYEFAKESLMRGVLTNHILETNNKNVLDAWVASQPWEPTKKIKRGTSKTTFGLANDQPKAWWKFFKNKNDFDKQLIFDSDSRVLKSRQHERKLANAVLEHAPTAKVLNKLRRPIGDDLWKHDRYLGQSSYSMAYGIFGDWNADESKGGYPKSLTPVHTDHEVMDPVEDDQKGIYANPFTYEGLKDYVG